MNITTHHKRNKKKIINDPLYGFINIPSNLIFDIIEHPYFQRLRYIKQLGLTYLVYPGATHTRFQHVLGAMHLMQQSIDSLKSKSEPITARETESALIAILLHDIGHGPFSHTLEHSLVSNISHEEMSVKFIERLNTHFKGALDLTLEIFANVYPKKFLHQLVSSQLDVDRLDYLNRDSFFSGVTEGVVGIERIIKMLTVVNGELAVEAKGIYSIEKFLIARRIMYWQVYLHKTVVAAEVLLLQILKRAKELIQSKKELFAPPALAFFLKNNIDSLYKLDQQPIILDTFAKIDDNDIFAAIKTWTENSDKILATLCKNLIFRQLPHTEISQIAFDIDKVYELRKNVAKKLNINIDEAAYFVASDAIENKAYSITSDKINILYKDGKLIDIAEASDISNVSALAKTVVKYYLSYPKEYILG